MANQPDWTGILNPHPPPFLLSSGTFHWMTLEALVLVLLDPGQGSRFFLSKPFSHSTPLHPTAFVSLKPVPALPPPWAGRKGGWGRWIEEKANAKLARQRGERTEKGEKP